MFNYLLRAQLGLLGLTMALPIAVLGDGFWLRLVAVGALFVSGMVSGYNVARHAQAVSRQ